MMQGWMGECRDKWVNAGVESCSFWRTLPLNLRRLTQDPQVKSTGQCDEMSHVLINKHVLSDEPSSESQVAFPLNHRLYPREHTHYQCSYKICWFLRWAINLWWRFVALLTELQSLLINFPCFSQVPLKRKKRLMCKGEIRAEPRHLILPFRCCFVPVTRSECFISQSVSQLSQA